MNFIFLGIVKKNDKCRKCSLLGTENSFCNTSISECICKNGYFGGSCEKRKFINLNSLKFSMYFSWYRIFWNTSYRHRELSAYDCLLTKQNDNFAFCHTLCFTMFWPLTSFMKENAKSAIILRSFYASSCYTGGHISRHRQFFSLTFWSVQP